MCGKPATKHPMHPYDFLDVSHIFAKSVWPLARSPPVFLQGWGEATCRDTCQCYLQLPPTAALTDPDTDITDVVPDVEITTPGIDRLDKKYFTTQKWNPLVLCRIIQAFMMGTI
jgi:hypothetical protein